jgi:hypothetical protein
MSTMTRPTLVLSLLLVLVPLGGLAAGAPKYLYNEAAGEWSLIDPPAAQADADIRAVCRRFATENEAGRTAIRKELSPKMATLMFAERQAVFVIRTRDKALITDALMAVSLMRGGLADDIDIRMALALVHHAAGRIGVNADPLFQNAASLATPSVGRLIAKFAEGTARYDDLRKWSYEEVTTEHGAGFLLRGIAAYAPNYDLSHLAIELARIIGRKEYTTTSVFIAWDLPAVWFGRGNLEAAGLLKHAHGGASIHAEMLSRDGGSRRPEPFLMILVQELDSEKSAQRLVELAATVRSPSYVAMPIANRTLFCLLIAEPGLGDDPPVETQASIQRFAEPIRKALAATRGPRP